MVDTFGIGHQRLTQQVVESNFGMDKTTFNYDEMLFILKEITEEGGKKYLLQQPTIRSSMIYKQFVQFLFDKNLSNLDTMVLLTAMKGGGKSSVAIMLAREWCACVTRWAKKNNVDRSWKLDLNKHIAYTNAGLSRKIETLPPFSPLIADESVRFISSEDWNKKENKELKKKLAQIREKHFFFLLCFPLKIKKVEKTYLESFVNYWMEVYARGYVATFMRDNNPVFDSWRLEEFKKIGTYNEFTSVPAIQEKLKKHPNFWKLMKVPKVPDAMYSKYKDIREANVYNTEDSYMKSITKDDIYKSALLMALNDIMTNDKTITMHRIGLYVKNSYDITISKTDMDNVLLDAKQMVTSFREGMMNTI